MAFLRAAENSAVHALHVAGFVLAGIASQADEKGAVVSMMNYHSLMQPSLTPVGQPGFGILHLNGTGQGTIEISPVAQILAHLAALIRGDDAAPVTFHAIDVTGGPTIADATGPAGVLGDTNSSVLQGAAVVGGGSATVLVLNRGAAAVNATVALPPSLLPAAEAPLPCRRSVVYPYECGDGWAAAPRGAAAASFPWSAPLAPLVTPGCAMEGRAVVLRGHALTILEF